MLIGMRNAMLAGEGSQPSGYWGLCFTAEEAGSTVAMAKSGSPPAVTLEYSLDGTTWDTFTAGATTVTLSQIGDCVYLRAGEDGNKRFGQYTSVLSRPYWRFSLSGRIAASGDITSILNQSGLTDSSNLLHSTFYSLFRNCTALTTAASLKIPLDDLKGGACREMFYGCTGLTAAPEISASTMGYVSMAGGSCYQMFSGCTALTAAPELPATTLADYCYYSMFSGCTALTAAPELPATTLANRCYTSMFQGCTALTTAPSLNATMLADRCYQAMFQGCTALTTAPSLPATTLTSYCYYSMFSGCTGLTTAPSLPATTLTSYCYYSMFSGCTALTAAPELPATRMVQSCYSNIFNGCAALTEIEVGLITWTPMDGASAVNTDWLSGVAATGTFRCPAALGTNETITRGVSACPEGWTVINTDA